MADIFNKFKNFLFDAGNAASGGGGGQTGDPRGNTSSQTSGSGVVKKADQYRDDFIRSSSDGVQDPLYLTFGLNFNFFQRLEESESLLPGLLSGDARRYLSKLGDTQRVNKLDYFTNMLRRISIDEPWYFQTLDGLDKVMEIDLSKGMRSENRQRLTFTTLETIDMKIMSMIDAYRSVTTDKKFMRTILPENLKRFDLTVFVIDPRVIVKKERGGFIVDRDTQGIIGLKLYDCEFHFENFSPFVGSLNNSDIGAPRGHSFDISIGRIYDIYNLPTGFLYGFGGSGYSSDDNKSDYNFLSNVLRSNATNFAEIGNERRVDYDGQQVASGKKPNIVNVGEASDSEPVRRVNQRESEPFTGRLVKPNPTTFRPVTTVSADADTQLDRTSLNPASQQVDTEISNPNLERESFRGIIDS